MQHVGDLLNREKPLVFLLCGQLPSLLRCGLGRNFFRIGDNRLLAACVMCSARGMSFCKRCVLALIKLCWRSLHACYAVSLSPPPFNS